MTNSKNFRHTHSSPGLYFSESEFPVQSKNIGITKLGLVGETVKGPAFQVIDVTNWNEYKRYFGGTSTEKFKGSQYPKYEAPYIAKEYLTQSQSLQMVRVLGLSGVNAGPAWVITGYGPTDEYTETKPMVIAILRSRGEHKKAKFIRNKQGDECNDKYTFDDILYYAESVSIAEDDELYLSGTNCNPNFDKKTNSFTVNRNNFGRFKLVVTTSEKTTKSYSVSLNPTDQNYIYNVLGSNPQVGDSAIYVEELYDVALKQMIEEEKITTLGKAEKLPMFKNTRLLPKLRPVNDILTRDSKELRKSDLGKRFLYSKELSKGIEIKMSENGLTWDNSEADKSDGHIFTVFSNTKNDGSVEYFYGEIYKKENTTKIFEDSLGVVTKDTDGDYYRDVVYVNRQGVYYFKQTANEGVKSLEIDLNNYKSAYRYSSTPWVVSEIKGNGTDIDLVKLFRFHTISDGNNSVSEVKVSIENIDPTNGVFDVIVRDFNDTDNTPIILERYRGVNLVQGTPNFISLRIGDISNSFESKSKYITVEVNEDEKIKTSIPSGFLGYPVRNYYGGCIGAELGNKILQKPKLQYNTTVRNGVRPNRQYFGLSNLVGIDTDILRYKGVEAYNNFPEQLTVGFHLDSRILNGYRGKDGSKTQNNIKQTLSVDGVFGYGFDTVDKNITVGNSNKEPRIGSEALMMETIYENKGYRKFTVCFYGGFDGFDYYRTSRSTTDEFRAEKYRGEIDPRSGDGDNFSVIQNPENYGFEKTDKVITSDYYAYLSAIRMFANPKDTKINLLATSGVDYVNNNSLVNKVVEMVEEERGDCLYVMTTPDKPFGAYDSVSEMYTASDAVVNLEDSGVDSPWCCTFYPWVKYLDTANNEYIYLPPTKDVVRNMAKTDSQLYPWIASAGWERGEVNGLKCRKNLSVSEQDTLYDGRINFINSFASEGMRIWGDKNLQVAESHAHMNRISKRRCLIRLREIISQSTIGLLFNPNDQTQVKAFETTIQNIISNFVQKRAFVDAKVVIDESPETLDRLELNGMIYIKFMPNTEYIGVGFVATPNSVSFDDI